MCETLLIHYYMYYILLHTFHFFFFFFNDTATTEIYTLSLHDALPISTSVAERPWAGRWARRPSRVRRLTASICPGPARSEEHTSELQSPCNLVCRLLLEKKNKCVLIL